MARNRIVINGVSIDIDGNNVSVRGGTISVDGIAVASGLSGNVHISWDGSLASLDADGSVECGDVHGNVNAGGSVKCHHIEGSVNAGGSVKAASNFAYTRGGVARRTFEIEYGDVGSINAGGSVHARRGRLGSINAGGSVHID